MKELVSDRRRQLAVVHGLVAARSQVLKSNSEIYKRRCSPVSYGILYRERYDPMKHQGEDLVYDHYDKQKYAEQQVNWIIKQVAFLEDLNFRA